MIGKAKGSGSACFGRSLSSFGKSQDGHREENIEDAAPRSGNGDPVHG